MVSAQIRYNPLTLQRQSSLAVFMLAFALLLAGMAAPVLKAETLAVQDRQLPGERAVQMGTRWTVIPSLKLDAATLIGPLSGEAFYTNHYERELNFFTPKMTPEVRIAIREIMDTRRKMGGSPAPAWVANIISAWPGEDLTSFRMAVADPMGLEERLKATDFYSNRTWQAWMSLRPQLRTYLNWLDMIGYEKYWTDWIEPVVTSKSKDAQKYLAPFDVVTEVQKVLGRPLSGNELTVYVLYFNRPQGIRMTGTRYITNVRWSLATTARIAGHELLHPPYPGPKGHELSALFGILKSDPYLMALLRNRNPVEGYNNFNSFVGENIVQALDQVVSERLGIAEDPVERWSRHVQGTQQVLATTLYSLMIQQGFMSGRETAHEFFTRILTDGSLKPGDIAVQHAWFLSGNVRPEPLQANTVNEN